MAFATLSFVQYEAISWISKRRRSRAASAFESWCLLSCAYMIVCRCEKVRNNGDFVAGRPLSHPTTLHNHIECQCDTQTAAFVIVDVPHHGDLLLSQAKATTMLVANSLKSSSCCCCCCLVIVFVSFWNLWNSGQPLRLPARLFQMLHGIVVTHEQGQRVLFLSSLLFGATFPSAFVCIRTYRPRRKTSVPANETEQHTSADENVSCNIGWS